MPVWQSPGSITQINVKTLTWLFKASEIGPHFMSCVNSVCVKCPLKECAVEGGVDFVRTC